MIDMIGGRGRACVFTFVGASKAYKKRAWKNRYLKTKKLIKSINLT